MNIEDDDFPLVGLTGFDDWFMRLFLHMVSEKFVDLMDLFKMDREHWRMYYDVGYTPEEAFAEDLTNYGD
jgi:hypothetical protein